MRFDAVLLASFGGPESPDEVMPFLERVTVGRGVPRERLVAVAQHYLALGGVSPINAQNRQLIAALDEELTRRGTPQRIYWGNRNSAPFFTEALQQCHADGNRSVLAIATSAYSSYSGCRQYRENLAQALAESGLADDLTIAKIRPYYDQSGFIEPFAAGVAQALGDLARRGIAMEHSHVVFTTHAIPESMALTSGPADDRAEASPGAYERQHLDVAARVMRAAIGDDCDTPAWSLAFQSRSGPPQVPWLEPDINTALADLASNGVTSVVVVPIGFVSDHVEIIWDLDHEAAESAERLGLHLTRVRTPGTDPRFVAALADLVNDAFAGHELQHAPDWAMLCTGACCPNGRADLPVVPGV
jgi:ferrochelatase